MRKLIPPPYRFTELSQIPPLRPYTRTGKGPKKAPFVRKYPIAHFLQLKMSNSPQNDTTALRFWRKDLIVQLTNVHPSRTLLQTFREDLKCTGTKEGCGEGDCGACTVVIAELENEELHFRAVNSCIRPAHSVNSLAVWSVEDLVAEDGSLHPVQNAMLHAHASQCGFCTPGFVMSLFAMYQNYTAKGKAIDRQLAQTELAGNLCRCTGYRPILDAAMNLSNFECHPSLKVDHHIVKQKLESLATLTIEESRRNNPPTLYSAKSLKAKKLETNTAYLQPQSLHDLLAIRQKSPLSQLVAGATDVGLWITKHFKNFDSIIDLTQVQELRRIEEYPHHIAIGAGVKVEQAFSALLKDRPQLRAFAERFAGLPIRNSATLGGNIGNGSPIGDSMPMLIALGSSVVLMRMDKGHIRHREVMLEDFYTGYRTSTLKPTEVICWIKVPKPQSNEVFRAYKISKRFDDDISAVCLCINLSVSNGTITFASIGAGGVAATPAKARMTEEALTGQAFNMHSFKKAQIVLADEFQPLSDMRASAAYRKHILESLVQRFAIETLYPETTTQSLQHSNEVTPFWVDLANVNASAIELRTPIHP